MFCSSTQMSIYNLQRSVSAYNLPTILDASMNVSQHRMLLTFVTDIQYVLLSSRVIYKIFYKAIRQCYASNNFKHTFSSCSRLHMYGTGTTQINYLTYLQMLIYHLGLESSKGHLNLVHSFMH